MLQIFALFVAATVQLEQLSVDCSQSLPGFHVISLEQVSADTSLAQARWFPTYTEAEYYSINTLTKSENLIWFCSGDPVEK